MNEPIKKLTREQKKWIRITSSLTFRELSFLIQRYHLNMNLSQIAEQAKLTLERTRQIEITALKKITLFSHL